MTDPSDKLQEFVDDFANGNADDTCQDSFNRLVEYAAELETAFAKATVIVVDREKLGLDVRAVDPMAPRFTPGDPI